MSMEKYDQFLAIPIIIIIVAYLFQRIYGLPLVLLGFAVGLIGLLLFNKGNKATVNLKTDVTYIAAAFLLLVIGAWYVLFVGYDEGVIISIIVLMLLIGMLYR